MKMKPHKLLLIVVSILLTVGVGWLFFGRTELVIVSTPDQEQDLRPILIFKLSKNLRKNQIIHIETSPNFQATQKIDGDRLSIGSLTLLEAGKEYSVVIKEVAAEDGDKLSNVRFDFIVKKIPFNELSDDVKRELIGQSNSFGDDQLLSQLPFVSKNFGITHTGLKNNRDSLDVTLYIAWNPQSTTYEDYKKNENDFKKEALNWIEDNLPTGKTIDDYNINFPQILDD